MVAAKVPGLVDTRYLGASSVLKASSVESWRFTLTCDVATKTYKQAIWMKKYGHHIPKRTLLYSNSPLIRVLDYGRLRKSERGGDSGVRKTTDRKGRTRVQGTKKIKETQPLACNLNFRSFLNPL